MNYQTTIRQAVILACCQAPGSAPQLALPIVAEPIRTCDPVPHHVRPMHPVAVEQVADVPHHAEAARRNLGPSARALEVARQRCQPRLVEALVDDGKQRPHRPLGEPGVAFRVDPGRCGKRAQDHAARERELDIRAYPVAAPVGGRAEPGREALGEPPFDPAGRDGDHVGCERIGERPEQRIGETVGETVRALGSVDMQHSLRP